jgi:hypothetical protein
MRTVISSVSSLAFHELRLSVLPGSGSIFIYRAKTSGFIGSRSLYYQFINQAPATLYTWSSRLG